MWIPLPTRPIARPSVADRQVAIERLLAWAHRLGARWDGIELCVEATGNAHAVATRTLARGESILTIPRRAMIVDNELDESATGVPELGFAPRPWDVLAVWLPLENAAPESPWRPFLDSLPVHFTELPMFRDADDLAALEGTSAHARATELNRDVMITYDRLPPELRARLSLADCAWGRSIVMSRAFSAPGSIEPRIALLPLIDLFDHGTDDTEWSYSPHERAMAVRTEREIAAGDEVHFSYGDRSNSQLLAHYGFILPGTATDEAELVFEQPPSVPIRVRVTNRHDAGFTRALSLARLHACDPVERERILGELSGPTNIPFLGAAIEQGALDVLVAVARRARARLDAHVPRASTPAWDRTCTLIREGERAVLDQLAEVATSAREYTHRVPAELRATIDAIPRDARGARHVLRDYLVERIAMS
ncbi:MAG: DUF6525 family protein [Kofleriaceae bacterium]